MSVHGTHGVRPAVWTVTEAICREAVTRGGTTALMSFSAGKDSVSMWLAIREFFDRIVPIFYYHVPGLSFVERALAYYEDYFQTPVIRLPSPARMRWLQIGQFQPPHRMPVMNYVAGELPRYKWRDLAFAVRDKLHIPTSYHATGIKAMDSVTRRTVYQSRGAFSQGEQLFYPVIEWNLDDVEAVLDHHAMKLPPEYKYFGRSFDGIMFRYLEPIRQHFPADYQRILDDYPLAELEILRHQRSDAMDAWSFQTKGKVRRAG